MADPNFSSTALALRCNGTDASTTFTDISYTPKTVTAANGAQVDTAQSKFGGASGLFDGVDAKLTVPDNADFEFGTGAFTIQMWVRFGAFPLEDQQCLICKPDGTGYTPYFLFWEPTDSKLYLYCYSSADTLVVNITHQTAVVENTWYHVEVTRSGNTFRIFLDGVVGTTTGTSSASLKDNTSVLQIGSYPGDFYPLNGWLDDIVIHKGVALHTSTFTPPAAEYEGGASAPGIATESDLALQLTPASIMAGPVGQASETDTAFAMPITGYVSDTGLPLSPAVLGSILHGYILDDGLPAAPRILSLNTYAWISEVDLLGACLSIGYTDFSARLAEDQPTRFFMDLITPSGAVRVPISSWQSTLQTDSACYAGCVVPACTTWLPTIQVATEFVIYRQALAFDGTSFEVEVVRCPLDTIQTDEGPTNHTASLSGYFDPFATVTAPDASYDRTLTGIRSISVYDSGVRVRCEIDWLIRPGQRALYSTTSMVVSYINFYATQNTSSAQAYMDIGERVA